MKRREVIAGLALSAAWPFDGPAQQSDRMRRVGVIMNPNSGDAEGESRLAAFRRGLQQLGWIEGRNLRVDVRWAAGDSERIRVLAAELLALSPDAVLVTGSAGVGPMLQATRDVPVVFAAVPDPVGAGFVASMARPGGNATGFTSYEYAIGVKWLELLKEIAPRVARVAVIRDPNIATGTGQWDTLRAAAPSFGVDLTSIDGGAHDAIEPAIAAFANDGNGGLIVTGSPSASVQRDLITTAAAYAKLPAVYYARHFAEAGGLLCYGVDYGDQYKGAAGYVDRILKGESPSKLPVQAPTKFEFVINLKTAKALGITIPASLLARADEVIE